MVTEIESPYWNIFEPPIENNSTESYEYTEYREINVEVKSLKKYKIPVKDINVYIYPHNSYIHLRGRILHSNGTELAITDKATLCNNGFNLFSTAKYRIEELRLKGGNYFLKKI